MMTMSDQRHESRHDLLLDYNGWLFWREASEDERHRQLAYQRSIAERATAHIGEATFISELAMVSPDSFTIGARSYVAAHAYLTGTLVAGDDCTINVFTVVRGRVTLGDGVRIGAHTSILGFNHSLEPDRPVFRQPIVERGIVVGDDVWIGSNVVILDGVTVGSHAVIAAGAVVTHDVAEWAIVGGNPARFLRDRRTPKASRRPRAELALRLQAFGDTARAEADAIVERSWEPEGLAPDGTTLGRYVDAPGGAPSLRPHADAVEISMLLSGRPPRQLDAAEHIRRLRDNQDPTTGLTPEVGPDGRHGRPVDYTDGESQYHVLSLGYALDLLGSRFEHPIRVVEAMTPGAVIDFCEAQPWSTAGWSSGAAIDSLGTALLWNLSRPEADGRSARRALDTLVGWLTSHASRDTGMWSAPRLSDGLLQSVNGYYRASRGTLAQFGLPLPYPERVIDTVFDQIADDRHFGPGRTTACNVLDVAHPLWVAGHQTSHRRDEIRTFAAATLDEVLARWVPGAGFPFQFPPLSGPRAPEHVPGFKGTEMWLSTVWYLADLAGTSESLGYRPTGVHRPEPAHDLSAGAR
jgi:acetyltransferase-like isoleucine patch superfamily enzyme